APPPGQASARRAGTSKRRQRLWARYPSCSRNRSYAPASSPVEIDPLEPRDDPAPPIVRFRRRTAALDRVGLLCERERVLAGVGAGGGGCIGHRADSTRDELGGRAFLQRYHGRAERA